MSKEGDLHAALMAKCETVLSAYDVLWPQNGGDQPAGEHVRVYHLPNDNDRRFISDAGPVERKGFLVLTLVSPLGVYEAHTKEKAGAIAEAFMISRGLGVGSVRLHNQTVKQGQEIGERWETTIWIDYRGFA